jgi:hypothetical protein
MSRTCDDEPDPEGAHVDECAPHDHEPADATKAAGTTHEAPPIRESRPSAKARRT